MLLRFGVKNFRSLKTDQELSLVASSLDDDPRGLLNSTATEEKILPAIIIYGANASGKSNILRAISAMRAAVLYSHNLFEPNQALPFEPFALNPKNVEEPTYFDIDFIIEGIRYHYGFEQSREVFLNEWLYSFPEGRRRTLFQRKGNDVSFSRFLKGQNETIRHLMRPNSLFVSTAAQNNHITLLQIYDYFRSLISQFSISVGDVSASMHAFDKKSLKKVITLLSKLGTGAISYRRRKIDPSPLPESLWTDIEAAFKKHLRNYKRPQLPTESFELGHKKSDGTEAFFDLEEESDGTRRLLILLCKAFDALEKGRVLIVDELDASLHTQACETIISLFADPTSNPKGAQLIATTHDTNLLDSSYVRRDQVWFTEQQADGSTEVFPLTDIRTRKGDNIERGYLQGRFGAVPFQKGRWTITAGE